MKCFCNTPICFSFFCNRGVQYPAFSRETQLADNLQVDAQVKFTKDFIARIDDCEVNVHAINLIMHAQIRKLLTICDYIYDLHCYFMSIS